MLDEPQLKGRLEFKSDVKLYIDRLDIFSDVISFCNRLMDLRRRDISESRALIWFVMEASLGIGSLTAASKSDCAERRAGGTRMPNQRRGSVLPLLFEAASSSSFLTGDSIGWDSGSKLVVSSLVEIVLHNVKGKNKEELRMQSLHPVTCLHPLIVVVLAISSTGVVVEVGLSEGEESLEL